jgi:alkylation response protein AidB-like acyl-CoA dehydrogenase
MMATDDEAALFAEAVAGVLATCWGGAASAAKSDLAELWKVGAEHGWFELGSADALGAAIAATRELGRVACPLPILDGFVATRLLDGVVAVDRIESGRERVLVLAADDVTVDEHDCLEAGVAATHVMLLRPGGGRALLRPILERTSQAGLAIPAWSRVALGDPAVTFEPRASQVDEALGLLRLGLAVRALAAAERTHELAVEHAKTRQQFGRLIGTFGAVQQRTAECQIEVSAGNALCDSAVRHWEGKEPDALVCVEVAVEHVRRAAPFVQLGAHHTLAAHGYFEEHEGPWLFRRVHADIARIDSYWKASGSLGDVLVESNASLPSFSAGPVGDEFRREVRELLDRVARESAVSSGVDGALGDRLVTAMAERGWLGFAWPPEFGGRGASPAEQLVLSEEVTYGRYPVSLALSAVMLLGRAIITHGTGEQRERFLPLIRQGRMSFCLGYSEPDVGSDLASLRTRAVRDGDDWVINGQKMWTTGAHQAHWVWLAARTDTEVLPRQAGITVFLVPMATSGISVRNHVALSGDVSSTVYYDDVRIPDSARVGEVNGGWSVIVDALVGERISMSATVSAALHRQLDELLSLVRSDVDAKIGPRGSDRRARLGAIAARIQATRALVAAALDATGKGRGDANLAPMAAVLGGETSEEFGESVMAILGARAALRDVPGAPDAGFEYGLRLSVKYVVGGGTNDVQRGLIARGLGLPR